MEFPSGTQIFAGVVTSRPLVWFMPVRVILNCLGPTNVQWYNHWSLRPSGEFLLDLLIFCRHCNSWAAGYLKWFRTILCNTMVVDPLSPCRNSCWADAISPQLLYCSFPLLAHISDNHVLADTETSQLLVQITHHFKFYGTELPICVQRYSHWPVRPMQEYYWALAAHYFLQTL